MSGGKHLHAMVTDHSEFWMDRAACRGLDSNIFFADEETARRKPYTAACLICESCPVIYECLDYIQHYERSGQSGRHGVFGGMTPKMRQRMYRSYTRRKGLSDAV